MVLRQGQLIQFSRSFLEAIGLADAWKNGSSFLTAQDSLVLKNSSVSLEGLDFDSKVLNLDHGEISDLKYALWTGPGLKTAVEVPKNTSSPPFEAPCVHASESR